MENLSSEMELAIKRFHEASDAEDDYRKKAKTDLDVYIGNGQWDDNSRTQRISENRPALVINKLPGAVRQITNQMRQNMPGIHAIPVSDASEDVAEIYDGMMRHIQEASQAEVAYSTAFNSQVINGLGYFRVVTDYVSEDTFDQEVKIKRIKNPLAVYFDPSCVEPDYSDALYCFVTADISHAKFKQDYPGKRVLNNGELTSRGDDIRAWATKDKDSMRIAEYFSVEMVREGTLYLLPTGETVTDLPEGIEAIDQRPLYRRKIMWRMISAIEVLEEREWPGIYIPIIPCLGEDLDVDGKRSLKGMVRDAIDPQRMYNYWTTAQTEMIALAPKAPYLVAEGQIEGYKSIWANLNTKNYPVLPYKPTSIDGILIGPPQRQVAEPPVQAMAMAMAQASDDIKAVTGVFDASLGARSNETSGKAINARKMQGDIANYHFADNFAQSMLHLGRILVDLMPKIYSGPRVVRILGEDGESKTQQINQPYVENGIEKFYDITVGKYDVVVEIGPSYKTKRQEDAEMMANILQGNPELWKVAGDLLVKNFDWAGANQLAERLKKTIPPELLDEGEQSPEMMKQQLQQASMMIEQMTQVMNELQDEKEKKILELETKERIALEDNSTKLVIEAMKSEFAANQMMLANELKAISARLQLVDADKPIENDGPGTTQPTGGAAAPAGQTL